MYYKYLITAALSLCVSICSYAQCGAPVIDNFSPLSAATGTIITINGSNFNTTAVNNIIYFGAAKATATTATTTQLTVKVPLGATFNYLTVTNAVCNLTSYSTEFFSPISVCPGTFSASTVDARIDYTSPDPTYGPYAILFGDFDLDGKTDVVYPTAFTTVAPIVIARNQSVPGLIDLSSNIVIGGGVGAAQARNMAIADIDLDGKLDLISVDGGSSLRIYRNISSGPGNFAFASPVVYSTNSNCYQVASNDIDGDGKPDLAVGHFGSNDAAVYRNTSVPGTISFAAKQDFNSPGYSIALSDVDGDHKVDLLSGGNNGLYASRNTSTIGTISFAGASFTSGGGGYRIAVGDLNSDGKNDVAFSAGNVGIFRNTSSGGNISFIYSTINTANLGSQRVAISDVNGDGRPDIMACNTGTPQVAVALNTTTTSGGAITFGATPVQLTGTGCQYALGTADIDGDGNNDVLAGDWCQNRKLSVFRNNVLGLIPVTSSVSPTTGLVCNSTITIDYFAQCAGANPGNVYTAQLSDANGSFAVPVNIGSVTSSVSGSIVGTIPSCIATGTGYKVRVVGSDPAVTGTISTSSLSINCQTISPASIATSSITPTSYCDGASLSVPFIASGTFGACEENTFTAQLSDAGGSFASPINIGSVISTTSGSINAIIPPNTPAGNSYRIRVVSNQPSIVGTNNGSDITILNNCNIAPIAVCKPLSISADDNCQGTAIANAFDDGSSDPDGDPLSFSISPAGPYAIGTTNVTLTVADNRGGVSTCTTTVTVIDNTPPVITCPQPISVNSDPSMCGKIVNYSLPTVIDNCSGSGSEVETFSYIGAATTWTVPPGVTSVTITAKGSQGGNSKTFTSGNNIGGKGAIMKGKFNVNPGQILTIVVGGQPTSSIRNIGAGGGGGTGVLLNSTPLIIAGGGGGASVNFNGIDASTNNDGVGSSGTAGTNGAGGQKGYYAGDCGFAGGGGGLVGDGYGGNGSWDGGLQPGVLAMYGGGKSWANGGAGGELGGCPWNDHKNIGGFGCGGGGSSTHAGGGGGGYSGGGGGQYRYFDNNQPLWSPGGGGGSYNDGVDQENSIGHIGNGEVNISWSTNIIDLKQVQGLPSGSLFPIGTTTNTFEATDAAGNKSTCSFNVTVTDNEPPTVVTQNITVQLDATGQAIITPSQVDDGSSDACGIQSMSLSKTSFDCSNVGANTVTLTVTDANGNPASATAVVTVEDNVAPTVVTQAITVQLDASGQATITPSQVDNGSSDACGIQSMSLSKTSFDCSNVGANTVTLTVTDVNGNPGSATAVVTVEDKVKPTVLSKNITVNLANGNVTITPAQVDNGSHDACGIQSMSLDKTSFNCTQIGNHTVTLTVIDQNGNTSSATATVTVVGVIPSPSITVSRTDNTYTGPGTDKTIFLGYGAQSLNLAASDASVPASSTYSWSPSSFLSASTGSSTVYSPDATAVGTSPNTITLTATNQYGCTNTTNVAITVVDARCQTGKVLVCKSPTQTNPKAQEVCVSPNAVPALLAQGGQLGACSNYQPSFTKSANSTVNQQLAEGLSQMQVQALPNPSNGEFIVRIGKTKALNAEILILNGSGSVIERRKILVENAGTNVRFNLRNHSKGVYLVKVVTEEGVETVKVVIQ
ncbi:FG-GAP-like repeat-containing protein [Aridibaculum aurantiacum]|uniref:FG-GAP-like repeat-containing protein n=1 Tax=Aridibaculum aurantiacum TaxID=2810307 RepID=UPI001A97A0B8|nr:FG-GAP-like repeat-containing protein [Aridibaculum aurantiacum]